MAICARCQQNISIWSGGIDRNTQLCKNCIQIINNERLTAQAAARNAMLQSIAQGNLPKVTPTIHLESDEICYMELPVTYQKRLKSGPQNVQGRMIATNKKLHFLASSGSFTVTWGSVLSVKYGPQGFQLELSRQSGSGFYFANDPQYTAVVLDTITQISKRQVVPTKTASNHRTSIPQEIKTAVWQRDQGRCIQCGSNQYIEFDHIIPLSLGGAHSVNNIQLLCRTCNSKKSNHI
jgi:hypothetical protein